MTDTGHELLAKCYEAVHLTIRDFSYYLFAFATRTLEVYVLRWMLGGDVVGIRNSMAFKRYSRNLWMIRNTSHFVPGQFRTLEYTRSSFRRRIAFAGWTDFTPRLSFIDVESVVGSATVSRLGVSCSTCICTFPFLSRVKSFGNL